MLTPGEQVAEHDIWDMYKVDCVNQPVKVASFGAAFIGVVWLVGGHED